MAACPCGCGRNLGFMRRRTAVHATDLMVVFPILEHAGSTNPAAASILLSGKSLASRILASAHGAPGAANGVPSLSELNQWRRMANGAVADTARADPTFVQDYVRQLPADGQRLIRSMLR